MKYVANHVCICSFARAEVLRITTKLQAAGATLGADGVVVLPMAGLFFPMEWPVLWEELLGRTKSMKKHCNVDS